MKKMVNEQSNICRRSTRARTAALSWIKMGSPSTAVVHKACKIKGLRCRLTIELKAGDGEGLIVKVMELRPAKQTEICVTRERLIELWELEDTDHPR